jgi:surface antigen
VAPSSRFFRVFPLLATLSLAACGGTQSRFGGDPRYPGLSCVPFARALTGLALYGDAASWWAQADGRYARVHQPAVGSVLVLQAIDRLPSGHVAVVSRVVGPRRIEVIQANWVPNELEREQPVIDVSEDNDWSLVRVWYSPVGTMGAHAYPAYGFIVPDVVAGHHALARGAIPAALHAIGGG